jgi:hypothetical protein
MRVAGAKRKLVALAGIVILAALTWTTIGPGKVRLVGMIILGSFVVRIALAREPREDAGAEVPEETPGAILEAEAQSHEGLAREGLAVKG